MKIKLTHILIAAAGIYFLSKKSNATATSDISKTYGGSQENLSLNDVAKSLIDATLGQVGSALGQTVAGQQTKAQEIVANNSAATTIKEIPLGNGTVAVSYVDKNTGVPVTIFPTGTPAAVAAGGTLGSTSYGSSYYTSGLLQGASIDSPAAQVFYSWYGK